MGYERKRGKLADLNALLREGNRDGFSLVVGATAVLAGVKYVITLDTDTQLPRDAARQFVGTMAHPLNRPVYDAALGRVRAGYGILQPRVSVSLPGTQSVALCAPARRRAGHRPLYPRRLRRLPGRVPGRLVHRQGDLRRRCVRTVAQGALSREPDPQSRPAGRLLRPRRAVERRAVVRGIPGPLRRRRQPPPPLDPRRLAARGLAAAVGARARRAAPEESALGAVALEAVRQPAPQPGAGGVDAAVAAGLDGVFVDLVLDPGGARHPPDPARAGRACWTCCASRATCGRASISPPPRTPPASASSRRALPW